MSKLQKQRLRIFMLIFSAGLVAFATYRGNGLTYLGSLLLLAWLIGEWLGTRNRPKTFADFVGALYRLSLVLYRRLR